MSIFGEPCLSLSGLEMVLVESLDAAWDAANTAWRGLGTGSGTYQDRSEDYAGKLAAFGALAAVLGRYVGLDGADVGVCCQAVEQGVYPDVVQALAASGCREVKA